MKKILYIVMSICCVFSTISCEDMLDVENNAMVQNPGLNEKTDSVFFALGIAQALQELADQYYYIGELRGELVKTNGNTIVDLKELNSYSSTSTNKYVSASPYYKIINNCNYYLANRDTTLYTGATNVTINEYAAVAAWRAWAYLTLAKTYGKVPFVTKPLTTITSISEGDFPVLGVEEIVERLAPELEKYSLMEVEVPNFSTTSYLIGSTNWGASKTMNPAKLFVPVDVILGEMYLEVGNYLGAAQKYCKYLGEHTIYPVEYTSYSYDFKTNNANNDLYDVSNTLTRTWNEIFATTTNSEIITYIPMAVSSQTGTTTSIPLSFGYNYYEIGRSSYCPRVDEIQIEISEAYKAISDSTRYYYFTETAATASNEANTYPDSIAYVHGDGRSNYGVSTRDEYIFNRLTNDTTKNYIKKCSYANIYLYRVSTIYLHLAEAFSGMGYNDAAFAILRNGISTSLEILLEEGMRESAYMSKESLDMLNNEVPFLSKYRTVFDKVTPVGIHCHGGGTKNGEYFEKSQGAGAFQWNLYGNSFGSAVGSILNTDYLPKPEISRRINKIEREYGVVSTECKEDSIVAMMDILCDEYAMEFAFEGTRFYDLQRLARHFNEIGAFGGGFGDLWLSRKLAKQASGITTNNCYLQFK